MRSLLDGRVLCNIACCDDRQGCVGGLKIAAIIVCVVPCLGASLISLETWVHQGIPCSNCQQKIDRCIQHCEW